MGGGGGGNGKRATYLGKFVLKENNEKGNKIFSKKGGPETPPPLSLDLPLVSAGCYYCKWNCFPRFHACVASIVGPLVSFSFGPKLLHLWASVTSEFRMYVDKTDRDRQTAH